MQETTAPFIHTVRITANRGGMFRRATLGNSSHSHPILVLQVSLGSCVGGMRGVGSSVREPTGAHVFPSVGFLSQKKASASSQRKPGDKKEQKKGERKS